MVGLLSICRKKKNNMSYLDNSKVHNIPTTNIKFRYVLQLGYTAPTDNAPTDNAPTDLFCLTDSGNGRSWLPYGCCQKDVHIIASIYILRRRHAQLADRYMFLQLQLRKFGFISCQEYLVAIF